MHNIEKELASMHAAKPRPELDARIGRLFDEAVPSRPRVWAMRVPLWQTACACTLSLAFGFLLNAYVTEKEASEPAVAKTVYIVPMDPSFSRVFDATAATRHDRIHMEGAL